MLAAFIPPYPFRGVAAPYLWWYYRLLARWSGESAYFLIGREYTAPLGHWRGRWECSPDGQKRLGYPLPEQPHDPRHHYAWLDEERFGRWLAEAGGNPIEVFRRFLTRRDQEFEEELRAMLAAAPQQLEAVLTVCNVPALEAVCAERGIPVVHVELGPLRAPLYRETAYVDFRGVNGNTECSSRYEAWRGQRLPLDRQDMLHFFSRVQPSDAPATPEWDTGVVLQVEDDSNLVAFGNGMDNVGILALAKLRAVQRGQQVRVRQHPGSVFAVRDAAIRLDDSPDSPTFVQRSAEVLTINSSVGLEAILLGTPVQPFGDCSFGSILLGGDDGERVQRLHHYLLGYLVPYPLQLEPDYLRFRLGAPSEAAIFVRHLEEYMKQQGLDHQLFSELSPELRAAVLVVFANHDTEKKRRIAALEEMVQERDREIEGLLRSMSWKITAPLRWLHRRQLRRSASR